MTVCENCESSSEALQIFNFVKVKLSVGPPEEKKYNYYSENLSWKDRTLKPKGLVLWHWNVHCWAQDVMPKMSIETLPHNLVKLNMIYKIAMKSDLNHSLRTGACPHLCMFPFIKKVGERPGSARPTNENDITWPSICLRKVVHGIWFPPC